MGRRATIMVAKDISFFLSSRSWHTRFDCDWSSDVCSSDLGADRRRFCIHRRRTALHGYTFGDIAKRQLKIDSQRILHMKDDVRLDQLLESWFLYFEAIRSEERRVGKFGCGMGWN